MTSNLCRMPREWSTSDQLTNEEVALEVLLYEQWTLPARNIHETRPSFSTDVTVLTFRHRSVSVPNQSHSLLWLYFVLPRFPSANRMRWNWQIVINSFTCQEEERSHTALGDIFIPVISLASVSEAPLPPPFTSLPGFLKWCNGKEPACWCRRHKRLGFDPWVRKIPWCRKWQPAPLFLPGKLQRNSKTGERGRLQNMGSQRVGHYWACVHNDMHPSL